MNCEGSKDGCFRAPPPERPRPPLERPPPERLPPPERPPERLLRLKELPDWAEPDEGRRPEAGRLDVFVGI